MFRKATKKQAKLRLAITAPSGGGKSFTSLRIGKGMGGRIAAIDTEKKSLSKYADRFDFDVIDLQAPYDLEDYKNAIKLAGEQGYNVLIIDSLTHAWKFLLDEVNAIARTKFNGNTWAAWSEGTPMQQEFLDVLLSSPCHIIGTMRVKTEWAVEGGKPVKVGTSPEQRADTEYEFDMLLQGDAEHDFLVSKDRTGKFQDKIFKKPDEEFGRMLIDWLNDGEDPEAILQELRSSINDTWEQLIAIPKFIPTENQKITMKLLPTMNERQLYELKPKILNLLDKWKQSNVPAQETHEQVDGGDNG